MNNIFIIIDRSTDKCPDYGILNFDYVKRNNISVSSDNLIHGPLHNQEAGRHKVINNYLNILGIKKNPYPHACAILRGSVQVMAGLLTQTSTKTDLPGECQWLFCFLRFYSGGTVEASSSLPF